jgi:hypothetical protein
VMVPMVFLAIESRFLLVPFVIASPRVAASPRPRTGSAKQSRTVRARRFEIASSLRFSQ